MRKISLYLVRHYLLNMMSFIAIILSIIYIFDVLEILRRLDDDQTSLTTVLLMGVLKLPEVGQVVMPFAIMFSAMFTFWQLNRRRELVILRSTGLSVWQFLSPILVAALLLGFFQVLVVNPFSAALLNKFDSYEQTFLSSDNHLVTSLSGGLWLRQVTPANNKDEAENEEMIIYSKDIDPKNWTFSDVTIYKFDDKNRFVERIDSQSANLKPSGWQFNKAVIHHRREAVKKISEHTLPTDLTPQDIENSFASPETKSFWQLPGLIRHLHQAGFDTNRLRIHFHSLLALPLLFAAMVSIAAVISLKPSLRSGGTLQMIMTGIFAAFLIFFLANFLKALGASNQMPVLIAAWSPAVITLMIGFGALLSIEDG